MPSKEMMLGPDVNQTECNLMSESHALQQENHVIQGNQPNKITHANLGQRRKQIRRVLLSTYAACPLELMENNLQKSWMKVNMFGDNYLSGSGQEQDTIEGEPARIKSRERLEDLVVEEYSGMGEENADLLSGGRRW